MLASWHARRTARPLPWTGPDEADAAARGPMTSQGRCYESAGVAIPDTARQKIDRVRVLRVLRIRLIRCRTRRTGPSIVWHPRSMGGPDEFWEFDDDRLMLRREASINDVAIAGSARQFFWPPVLDWRTTPASLTSRHPDPLKSGRAAVERGPRTI